MSREETPAPAAIWAKLRSHFLETKPAAEREHIFERSTRVAQRLDQWAGRYPVIRRERVWPLALSVTAAAPFSTVAELFATAIVSLWVFTLDDLFDEGPLSLAELEERSVHYHTIAQGLSPPMAGDPLACALSEVRTALMQHPLFEALEAEWVAALWGTMAGMLQEHRWRSRYQQEGPAMLPTYAEYLACGRYSIGGPPHIWAALITTDDPTTPRHLAHLRSMEQIASTCIRLANDLQSHAKEMAEGKFNALVLLSQRFQSAGSPAEEAHNQALAHVREQIASGLQRLASLQAQRQTQTGHPEAAIADIARFVCEFYTRHDYHTFVHPATATDSTGLTTAEPSSSQPHSPLHKKGAP